MTPKMAGSYWPIDSIIDSIFDSIIDSTFHVSFMASVDQVAILTELNGMPLMWTLVVTVYMPKSATVLD